MRDYRIVSLWLCSAAVLLGISSSRFGYVSFIIEVTGFFVLTFFTIRHKKPFVSIFVIVLYIFSSTRSTYMWINLEGYEQYFGSEVSISGVVIDDAVYGYKRQVEFYISDIQVFDKELVGKVKIQGYGQIEVKRGDKVVVNGKLREGFASYQGSVSYAEYEVFETNTSNIEKLRHRLIASTYTVLPEPHASLGLGFLAGFRSLLPESLNDALSATGLTHIVAVSGYNTTILASAVQRFLAKRGSRYQVVVLTSLMLMTFLAITGQAPSIVRASIVSGLSLVAWFYGRKFRPSVLLLLSAAITAYWRPLDIWFSLGWWLSFTAFFGILILAPAVIKRLRVKRSIAKLIVETSSAQLMTLPIIIWSFSKLSSIAVLANVLILPAIPVTMLFTFLAGVAGMLSTNIGGLLSLPARIVMTYILETISLLANLEWALISISMSLTQMIASFLLIGLVTFILYKYRTSDMLRIRL